MSPIAFAIFGCSLAVATQTANFQQGVVVQAQGALQRQAVQQPRRQLAESVVRYMAANDELELGDLIVRSHVSDLQKYLRKTRGITPLADSRILKRICPDNSLLSRYYHQKNGKVLRQAAEALGSYAPLERLSASLEGQRRLQAAIDAGSAESLLQSITAAEQATTGPLRLARRIYTTEQLIQVYLEIDLSGQ